MSDTITSNGTFTVTIYGSTSKYVGDLSITSIVKSGSNAASEVKNIASGSWQALATGSLSDIRYMYFSNESTGTLYISTTTSTVGLISVLAPNDHSQIGWSGSVAATPLYATCVMPTSSSVLYYIVSEG